MQTNELLVELNEFNAGMKSFKKAMVLKNKKKKPKIEKAILAFDNGFLTIECNDITAVMNAKGQWHGKVEFSESVVTALSLQPVNSNPVVISYLDEKLNLGGLRVTCDWVSSSKGMIEKLKNPSLIDIFAMYRTQPVLELKRSGIDERYKLAQQKMKRALATATKRLDGLEITEEDLLNLIEHKITAKIDSFK